MGSLIIRITLHIYQGNLRLFVSTICGGVGTLPCYIHYSQDSSVDTILSILVIVYQNLRVPSQAPMGVHCTVYIVHCTVYIIHCSVQLVGEQ